MINSSNSSRFNRVLSKAILPGLAVTALFASAHSAHALSKAQKAFQAALKNTDIEAIAQTTGDTVNLNKYSQAKIYVKLALQEINARPVSTTVPPDSKNTLANHQDEIAETVAMAIAAIADDPKLLKVQKTPKLAGQVRSIIGTVLKFSGAVPPSFVRDVVGSASITVNNAATQTGNKAAIQGYLTKYAAKSQLLGTKANTKNTLLVQAAKDGINEGFATVDNGKYEDGNRASLFITIADPETDKRPA